MLIQRKHSLNFPTSINNREETMITISNGLPGHGSSGLEIELLNPERVRIRSTWPVKLPKGGMSAEANLLSKALEEGLEATGDPHRPGFFEADVGGVWCYFHIAFGRVYLVASARPHAFTVAAATGRI